ncbi:MAG: DUF445 family protein [Rhodothermales bacterium]
MPTDPVIQDEPAQAQSLPEARQLTRARARDLRSLVTRYVARHMPTPPPKADAVEAPPRLVGGHAKLLPLLQLIPAVLGVLFIVSFWWDFNGVVLAPFGYSLELEGLLRILSVSGMIGFLTNWLAITMLFNPQEQRPIFGQGLIPAQRERVIYRLAKAVSEELINEDIIKAKIEESNVIPRYREMALGVTRGVLEDTEFRADLKGLTAEYVDQVLASEVVRRKIAAVITEKLEAYAGRGIGGIALKAYRFLNEDDFQRRLDEAVQELPQSLDVVLDQMDTLLDTIPEKIEARSQDIELWATRVVLGFVENLDVYAMVMQNMQQYDEGQLENLLKRTTNEQLNYIKYLGGILGGLGGLVIWDAPFALVTLGSFGAILWGIDEVMYRAQVRTESTVPQLEEDTSA